MTYAVISDIHANAGALAKVLADAWKQGATHIVCLGDVVGYGPEPARSVAMLRVEKATVVAGNHDDAVSGRIDAANFIDLAAEAVERHRAALRDDEKEWLGALPYMANIEGDAVCVHGDLTAPREFKYIESTADAAANFAVCGNQLIFVGHTHEPCLFITGGSGKTYKTRPQDFTAEPGKRYIVNPGSVGYPREENGTCVSSYVLYDSDRHEVRFRFLPFSVASVMQRGTGSIPPQTPHSDSGAAAPAARRDSAGTRERRIVALAACAIVAIFLATLAVVVNTRSGGATAPNPPPEVAEVASANADSPKQDSTIKKTLYLNGREKDVRANVILASKKAPAILTIDFLNQAGAVISTKTEHFTKSKRAKTTIPQGTHRVVFTLAPENPDSPISVTSFNPTAE